jgi:antitoxin HicB
MITMIVALIKDRRPVPLPAEGRGRKVAVPALLAVKIALHNEMLAQKVTKAELGRRLHQHSEQIDRLVNVRHGSKLEQLEAAFSALGKRIDVRVCDATTRHAAVTHDRGRRKNAVDRAAMHLRGKHG